MLIKNPKGRIVDVTEEMGEYLLAERPKKTIDGRIIKNKDGDAVIVQKGAHEKGYTKPTDAEIKRYEQQSAEGKAGDAKVAADVAGKKADKEQEKADKVNKEAEAAKKAADEAAKKAGGGAGAPTPDN